jgi:hypothetical protein
LPKLGFECFAFGLGVWAFGFQGLMFEVLAPGFDVSGLWLSGFDVSGFGV